MLLSFMAREATACDGSCVLETVQQHNQAGRLVYKDSSQGEEGYYTRGGDTFVGRDIGEMVSLAPSQDAFDEVIEYYQGYYEMEEVFYAGCGNLWGVVFVYEEGCYCCYFTVYVEVDSWIPKSCDSDCDGLDDEWEMDTFNSMYQDGQTDYDNDGAPDILEYLAGTDATDGNSIPKSGNRYVYDNLGRIRQIIRQN